MNWEFGGFHLFAKHESYSLSAVSCFSDLFIGVCMNMIHFPRVVFLRASSL